MTKPTTIALRFTRASMVAGQYHDAGTTAAVPELDALQLVRRGAAEVAEQARAKAEQARAKAKADKD